MSRCESSNDNQIVYLIVLDVFLRFFIQAIKDLVKQANFECTQSALQLQALDTSHVAMIKMILKSDGFTHFRCDRNVQLGINTDSLSKIFKCADNNDSFTLRADDDGDTCTFVFENSSELNPGLTFPNRF